MARDERFRWFTEIVDPRPDDRILEIGPGSSDSPAHLAARLDTGHIVGVDRSATATARAGKKHAALIAAGRLRLVTAALEELTRERLLGPDATDSGGFDKILAVNVNLFWTRDATAETRLLRTWLAPGGTLYLFYGYGNPGTSAPVGPRPDPREITEHLTAGGFTVRTVTSGELLGLIAEPA